MIKIEQIRVWHTITYGFVRNAAEQIKYCFRNSGRKVRFKIILRIFENIRNVIFELYKNPGATIFSSNNAVAVRTRKRDLNAKSAALTIVPMVPCRAPVEAVRHMLSFFTSPCVPVATRYFS